ncbi:MAG: membrane protein insertase YidC [Alphaproteobacteria bacterium]|nr:membrane protein insertase YidC [Alphaproteobacteria bacterium]
MKDNKPDSTNLIVAMLLCVVVMVAWQFFFVNPQVEKQREAAQRAAEQQKTTAPTIAPTAPGAPVTPALLPPGQTMPLEDALKTGGARLEFDNPKVDGSIRLTGGQIDNLRLKDYRETVDPKSPEIVFLTPHGTTGATFAEIGWTRAPGSATPIPDSKTVWNVASGTKLTPSTPVTLTWDNGQGLVFKRNIALDANYMFTVTDTVENGSGAPVTLYPYAVVAREGEPQHATNWILHEGLVGVLGGSLQDKTTYAEMRDYESKELKLDSTGGWVGITDKYWMATLIPPQKEQFTGRFSLTTDAAGKEVFRADYLLGARNVPAGGAVTVTHNVYAGAKVVSLIEEYQEKLDIFRFDMTIDWGWFSIITYWMFKGLDLLNKLVGNFGVAIILLTIGIKILFFPLANRSYESMAKMKKVQPQMKEIQERNKEDRMKQQQELAALFKREKVNPMMGCLPILVQIPVFFSLYKVLFVTIEMRHAPFFGWIQDLAAADPTSLFNLFGLLPFVVPTWLHVGVWPVLMGITMWFQTKMNPPATDPVQQQMMVMMPPVFTYLMASFPAGLVIYWTVNNLLSIGQQYVIMRRMDVPIDIGKNFKLPAWLSPAKKPPDQAPGE